MYFCLSLLSGGIICFAKASTLKTTFLLMKLEPRQPQMPCYIHSSFVTILIDYQVTGFGFIIMCAKRLDLLKHTVAACQGNSRRLNRQPRRPLNHEETTFPVGARRHDAYANTPRVKVRMLLWAHTSLCWTSEEEQAMTTQLEERRTVWSWETAR